MHTLTPLQEGLPTLLTIYECRGHFDEVLSLLEAGFSSERAHVHTNCQALSWHSHLSTRWVSSPSCQFYIGNTDPENVQPLSVMEHLKLFVACINIAKVGCIWSCHEGRHSNIVWHLWPELVSCTSSMTSLLVTSHLVYWSASEDGF